MINKIDFIVCGTQKGGTSALDTYLREHPEICMADNKEIHFFDNDSVFQSGIPDYSLYHSTFNPKAHHQIMGEATPIYMYWYDAPKRIWQYNPDIKLIIILRNPIERAFSHWNMERSRNTEQLFFWDALINKEERCRTALPYQHRIYSYIDRGHYLEQLRRLWHYFPKKQILILKNEILREQPHKTLDKICNFLGVDTAPMQSIAPKEIHKLPYISPISCQEKEYLQRQFRHEILNLEQELNWNCSDWLSN